MGCSLLSITEIFIFLTSLMSNLFNRKNKVKILNKRDKADGRVFTASNTFPLMKKLNDLEYQLKVNVHGVEKSIQVMSRRLRSLEIVMSNNEKEIIELKKDLERIVSKTVKKELNQLKYRRI